MRILITGGSGLIGYRLVTSMVDNYDVAFTVNEHDIAVEGATRHLLDIRDLAKTRRVVNAVSPDVIIHSAAMTDVDSCEQNPAKAEAVNVGGTINIVEACEEVDAKLALFSTAFVFDGTSEAYEVDDSRNPVNVYGETKAAAERVLLNRDVGGLIFRTDQPYCWSQVWQSPTMVEWVLDQLATGEPFSVFKDWANCPTYLPDLVATVSELIQSNATGRFHCVGDEFITRLDWAREIARAFDHDPTQVRSGRSTNAGLPAVRPNVRLVNDRAVSATGVTPHDIPTALRRMRQELSE